MFKSAKKRIALEAERDHLRAEVARLHRSQQDLRLTIAALIACSGGKVVVAKKFLVAVAGFMAYNDLEQDAIVFEAIIEKEEAI